MQPWGERTSAVYNAVDTTQPHERRLGTDTLIQHVVYNDGVKCADFRRHGAGVHLAEGDTSRCGGRYAYCHSLGLEDVSLYLDAAHKIVGVLPLGAGLRRRGRREPWKRRLTVEQGFRVTARGREECIRYVRNSVRMCNVTPGRGRAIRLDVEGSSNALGAKVDCQDGIKHLSERKREAPHATSNIQHGSSLRAVLTCRSREQRRRASWKVESG